MEKTLKFDDSSKKKKSKKIGAVINYQLVDSKLIFTS